MRLRRWAHDALGWSGVLSGAGRRSYVGEVLLVIAETGASFSFCFEWDMGSSLVFLILGC